MATRLRRQPPEGASLNGTHRCGRCKNARAGERMSANAVPVSGSPTPRAGHDQAERSYAPAARAKASGDTTVDQLVLMLRGAPANCAPLEAQMLQREGHHV